MADQNLIRRRIISSEQAIAGERLKLMIPALEPASSLAKSPPSLRAPEREREGNKMMVSASQNSAHVSNF